MARWGSSSLNLLRHNIGRTLPIKQDQHKRERGQEMKVKDLRKELENYGDEDDILVLYWDKYCADSYVSLAGDREEITPEQWAKVLEEIDNDNALEYDLHSISEIIHAKVEKVVPIGSEGATNA